MSTKPNKLRFIRKDTVSDRLLIDFKVHSAFGDSIFLIEKDLGDTITIDGYLKLTKTPIESNCIINNERIVVIKPNEYTLNKKKTFHISDPDSFSKACAYIPDSPLIQNCHRMLIFMLSKERFKLAVDYVSYFMVFEAHHEILPDSINVCYAETPSNELQTMSATDLSLTKWEFDDKEYLYDKVKSFIKDIRFKYNVWSDQWNCKIYIKSYSPYSETAIEDVFDLNSMKSNDIYHLDIIKRRNEIKEENNHDNF